MLEEKFNSLNKIVQNALLSLKAFQEADEDKGEHQIQGSSKRREVKWMPPTGEITKINFDATMNKVEQKMGISLVARNFRGEMTLRAAKKFDGIVELAEAFALWRAMEICSELQIQKAQFKGDALKVINNIYKKEATSSWFGASSGRDRVYTSSKA